MINQPVHPTHCPACGKPIEPQGKSCPHCGLKLEKEMPVAPTVDKSKIYKAQSLPPSNRKGFPTWGWLLIVAGGACCLGLMLLLFGVAGYMLLKPDAISESPKPGEVFTLPEIPAPGDLLPGDIPLLPEEPSGEMTAPLPESDVEQVDVVDTWFVQDPDYPSYVMFGSVLRNSNPEISLKNVELQAVAYNSEESILSTGNLYAYVMLPGEELAIGGSGGLTIPEGETVQRVEVKVTKPGNSEDFELDGSPFSISDVEFHPDITDPLAVGTLSNQSNKSFGGVMISAIALDAKGNVIGGSSEYNDVYLPANASIPVMVNLKVNGELELGQNVCRFQCRNGSV